MTASKPVVFVTRKLPEAVEERLRRDYAPRLNPDDAVYGPDELIEGADGASLILTCATDPWPRPQIERLPESVRAIATFSVGVEHIDLAAASARGITVTNTPDVVTEATADITLLCLLGAARRAFEAEALIRTGRWAGWTPTQLLGLELSGTVLGIVGMGRIGQAVARRARGFGMHVHYHNRHRLPPELEQGAWFHHTLASLLPQARCLSLHCPAGPETHHLINRETLGLLPLGRGAGQRRARQPARRRRGARSARQRPTVRRRLRRLRRRARSARGLPDPAQLLPFAPSRQRHGRDPQRHGLSLPRQSRRPGRRPPGPRRAQLR